MTNIPPKPFTPLLPFVSGPLSGQRTMFRTLAISASGLSAQRLRMEVVAGNIANAETTRDANGQPYQRRVVQMTNGGIDPNTGAPIGFPQLLQIPIATSETPNPDDPPAYINALPSSPNGPISEAVQIAGVGVDTTEGPLVYDPGHPDANAQGYVRYPNVRITDEMVDLIDARRVYEANATVFQSAKAMLKRAIDI